MSNWSAFEQSCADYLNSTFGKYAVFECKGGSDSTISDIKVITKSGKQFYLEAKSCPAQCGQFVLFPDEETKSFRYSDKNVSPINPYSTAIINHMNSYFKQFREAGTAGRGIVFENGSAVFASWIIQAYKNKGVRFVITNGKVILPIDDFAGFFDITATYRIKKSGSGKVGNTKINAVENFLKATEKIQKFWAEDGKLFVSSKRPLHGKRFSIDKEEYMFSKRDTMYEIRKLSRTRNGNVIFSIDSKKNIPGLSDQKFISFLI